MTPSNSIYRLGVSLLTLALLLGALTISLATPRAALAAPGGPVILGGDDLTDHGGRDTSTNTNHTGWLYLEKAIENVLPAVTRTGNDGTIAALGSADSTSTFGFDAGAAMHWAAQDAGTGVSVTYYNGEAAINAFFGALTAGTTNPAIIWIAGNGAGNDLIDGPGDEAAALTNNATAIGDFVNSGGGLISHGSEYGWLSALLPGATVVFSGNFDDLYLTTDGQTAFPGLTNTDINAGPWHNHFEGNLGGLKVLAASSVIDDNTGADAPVILGGAAVTLPGSITLDPATDTNPVGAPHTVTATVRNNQGQVLEGVLVNFQVTAGPNTGDTGTDTTDVNGQATFTWTGDGGAGTDTVQASFVDGSGTTRSTTASKVWEGSAPPAEEVASGTKYYDANANGQLDAGEAGLGDWPIDYDDGTTSASVLTDAAGNFSVELDPGTYTLAERQAGSPWFQTGNTVDQSGGTADVTLNADMTYTTTFDAGETATGLNFGNLCVGAGGGLTLGFWGNKNGQALIGEDDLGLLRGLNLVNQDGSAFDPTTAGQVRTWLRDANAVNMAYMLSTQLAAMALNVHNGFVQGSALVYAPDTTSANAAGFATVSALMAEANAELALHPTAVSGDAWRDYQTALKDALDNANNSLTFVQATASTCPAPFDEASFDLFADGSVSCVGADDTSRDAGSVTFVESAGQVLFSVSLDGAAPNASYTLAISEEPTCGNAVFFPDAITTDANGDGSFSGSFAKAAGTYNLLVGLVTSPVPSDPTNREIATVDTMVVVH